jgi:hypothetical protein
MEVRSKREWLLVIDFYFLLPDRKLICAARRNEYIYED